MGRRGLVAAVATLLVAPASSGCYVLRQASGQLRITRRSIPVERALADPSVSDERKAAIREIAEIKAFGERVLGMSPSRNYTTYYDFGGPALAWAVTACPADSLEPYTWSYPVVGRVSYRGDFSQEEAREEADRLREQGYDVYLRPVKAYSTLGWFRDPILPYMLELPAGERAELILHELTHGIVYAKGRTSFNESLASFVGREGARAFMAERGPSGSPDAEAYEKETRDAAGFQSLLQETAGRLRELYASDAPLAEKLRRKGEILEEARARPACMPWEGTGYGGWSNAEWNNAFLVAHLTYEEVQPIERLFTAVDGDWNGFWEAARACARARDPWEALRERAESP